MFQIARPVGDIVEVVVEVVDDDDDTHTAGASDIDDGDGDDVDTPTAGTGGATDENTKSVNHREHSSDRAVFDGNYTGPDGRDFTEEEVNSYRILYMRIFTNVANNLSTCMHDFGICITKLFQLWMSVSNEYNAHDYNVYINLVSQAQDCYNTQLSVRYKSLRSLDSMKFNKLEDSDISHDGARIYCLVDECYDQYTKFVTDFKCLLNDCCFRYLYYVEIGI